MQRLVTRFHLLLLAVTIAITGVGFFRVPADFAYPAHWSGSYADWLWPRDLALPVAPLVEVLVIAAFFLLGRLLSKNHFAKVQHILDPALTLLLAVVAAIQLGLLVIGIGSDIDLVRLTGAGLGIVLLILGIVFSRPSGTPMPACACPGPSPRTGRGNWCIALPDLPVVWPAQFCWLWPGSIPAWACWSPPMPPR